MPNSPILNAITAHRLWVHRLEMIAKECIEVRNPDSYIDFVNCQTCAFGNWLISDTAKQLIDIASYDQIFVVHEQMHKFARLSVSNVATLDESEINGAIKRVKSFSMLLISKLEEVNARF